MLRNCIATHGTKKNLILSRRHAPHLAIHSRVGPTHTAPPVKLGHVILFKTSVTGTNTSQLQTEGRREVTVDCSEARSE